MSLHVDILQGDIIVQHLTIVYSVDILLNFTPT